MIHISSDERDAILRTDFLAFAEAAHFELEPDEPYEPTWHHEAIAAILLKSEVVRTRKFINAPPRSFKSFLVSVAWVAFKLGRNPAHKFACISYSQPLSLELSSLCRKLMQSPFYKRLFPTRLEKASEEKLRTYEGGYRIATSIEGSLTGRGAQTIIVDDAINAQDARSEAKRTFANNWFTGTLLSRTNDKRRGAIFVVAQRLHQEDLTGVLIGSGWDGLVLPAIAPKDMEIDLGNRMHLWKAGEPLQERESLTLLAEIRKDDPDVFAAQYLQDPVPEAGNMLKVEWLKQYVAAPVLQSSDRIVLSIDTASKVGKDNDYSVCLTALVRNKTEVYVLDVWRQKVDFGQLCAAIVELAKKHSPNVIFVEEHNLGTPLIAHLKRAGLNGVIGITQTQAKEDRMYGQTARLQAGELILPQAASWLNEFMHEYRAFPQGKHDDQIDALSQLLAHIGQIPSGTFIADFGFYDDCGGNGLLGAPSPEDLLMWYTGRNRPVVR